MAFDFNDHLIPLNSGHAVGRGWTTATDREPRGVTWHWTALRSLKSCRRILGGDGTKKSKNTRAESYSGDDDATIGEAAATTT